MKEGVEGLEGRRVRREEVRAEVEQLRRGLTQTVGNNHSARCTLTLTLVQWLNLNVCPTSVVMMKTCVIVLPDLYVGFHIFKVR